MELATRADRAGIVGASGTGQPLGERLRRSLHTVIANGAECEPLLATDRAVVERHVEGVVEGLTAAMGATGALTGILALRRSEHGALAAARRVVGGAPHLKVAAVPDQYPIGDAHVLVPELLGRVLPEGGRPEEIGVLVANVHTLWHLGAALADVPVTWRYVTVAGEVAQPRVARVPVGMYIADLLERCGGVTVPDPVFIVGGPLHGRLTEDAGAPLGRADGGLVVLSARHPLVVARRTSVGDRLRQAASACGGCRLCTEACPRGQLGHALAPHEIVRAVAFGGGDAGAVTSAPLCSGCGVCEVVCPAGLSPRALYGAVQVELTRRGFEGGTQRRTPTPLEGREGRRLGRDEVVRRMDLTAYVAPLKVDEADLAPARVAVGLGGRGGEMEPLVSVGDEVGWGQVLARPRSGDGPWVHASIMGRVSAVEPTVIRLVAR